MNTSTTTNALCTFTSKGLGEILAAQGSEAWVLDRKNALQCEYVICTQNQHKDEDWVSPSAPHGTAFVVGRLKEVIRSQLPDCENRWLLVFSEYAEINIPDAWPGSRNPVWYTSLEALGIDASRLNFKKMPVVTPQVTPSAPAAQPSATPQQGLTIAQAKAGLAMTYGVDPTAIEIIVRG